MSPLTLNVIYQGRGIRMVGTPERPQWVAADVASVLGIAQIASTLRHFDEDEKGVHTMHTPGGPQLVTTVTEPGLYRLIIKSRRDEARAFRRWVCHDVLPTIRRFGRYPACRPPTPQCMLTDVGLFGQSVTMDLGRGRLPPLAADIMPRTELIPLKAVPLIDWLPVSVKASTVYRWHQFGLRGNHLDTLRIAGKLFTTEAAVLSFCSRAAGPNPATAAA
jgi:hypothetical protein